MSEQLDAVYAYMAKNGKGLHVARVCKCCGISKQASEFYRTRQTCRDCQTKRVNEYNKRKRSVMTVDEIVSILDGMSTGAKTNFCRYMVDNGVFKKLDSALDAIKHYGTRKANSATFLKRQQISDHFKQWRYEHGAKTKHRKKFDIVQDYNERLSRYWESVV